MNTIYFVQVNLLCVSVLMVLLFTTVRLQSHLTLGKLYIRIAILTIILCFSDLVSGVTDGLTFPGSNILLWCSNIIYLCALPIIAYIWTIYSEHVIRGKNASRIHMSLLIPLIILCLMIISAPLNGAMFTIDNQNVYHRGSLLWLQWAYACVCLLVPNIYALRSRKRIQEWNAIVIFSIAPIVCSVLQVLFYGISTIHTGITFSTILLYVMLQSGEVNASHAREQLMDQLSQTDVLTGIPNRRSYELALNDPNLKGIVGVIFCDVNGLKITNDVYGHKAGDQLIINFVRILKESFPNDCIYRISGDEFVVLLPVTDNTVFESRASAFAMQIVANARIASIGWDSGNSNDILSVISSAEKKMYSDKHDYYVTSGRDRRK